MKEHTLDTSLETPAPSEAPHFDDELTVLTAQPVVPLQTIDAKQRHRRYWFLAGAFTIAMTLGAGSALLASYLKLRNVPNAAAQAPAAETGQQQPVAEVEPVASDLPVADSVEEESPDPEPPKPQTAVKRRTIVARKPYPEPDERPMMSEGDDLRSIRDAVLVDQWEERRARRVLRRERRRANRSDRNLSNLDEIFEGRRRP